ncbi:DUF427 domain-containing protein [Ectothiorhodospiraceae bacterium WFHF3C12]|nr:DUF427 domain-containing protein [Ectothiorhodospiraceae bacterium WFHF3C12]
MDHASDSNPAPGFSRSPEHRVDIVPGPRRVRVEFAGAVIADSADAVTVQETGYEPVHYLPLADIKMALLQPSERTSYCPFKGRANYYSAMVADRVAVNAAWTYASPYDEVAELRERIAFYPDRVAISVDDDGRPA